MKTDKIRDDIRQNESLLRAGTLPMKRKTMHFATASKKDEVRRPGDWIEVLQTATDEA